MTTTSTPQIPPAEIWVVIGEYDQPVFSATWPDACHEHINDAIMNGDLDAAKWVVRRYVPEVKS